MANQLMNIVRFVAVAPGATVALPHLLHNEGQALVPDFVNCTTSGTFAVAADAANVTVTNNGAATGSLDAYCISWHTTARVLGAQPALTPQPFITVSEAGAPTSGALAASLSGTTNTIVPSGAVVPIPLNSVDFVSGPPSMAAPPALIVPVTGIYQITSAVDWLDVVSAQPVIYAGGWAINGLPNSGTTQQGDANGLTAIGVGLLPLNAGDAVTMFATQTNAAGLPRTVQGGSFSINRIA